MALPRLGVPEVYLSSRTENKGKLGHCSEPGEAGTRRREWDIILTFLYAFLPF